MQMNPFEGQLERLARTLTEQYGVEVLRQADEAWTDGEQIVLPLLPEPLDEMLDRMVVGFLDHEMSHIPFSDFTVAEEFGQKHARYDGILNVVEDALIECRATFSIRSSSRDNNSNELLAASMRTWTNFRAHGS